MDIDIILFIMRVISLLLLLTFMGAIVIVIWKEYRSALEQVEAGRRSHGYLIAMHEIDDAFIPTGDVYPILPITTLGRAPTNTIIIDDTFASSEHALLARRHGQWWLEDRQSRNGTTLNKELIRSSVVVTNGDIIGVGSQHFRLEIEI